MNLSEERNYQKRMEVLEALKLTPVNRQIAEEYLDMTRPEQPELLKKAEHQDFFGLSKDSGAVYRTYVEHLRKRERQEESARFMRLVAAVGGSSAGFFLGNMAPWTFKDTESTLRSEQVLAIRAEMISRNIYLLRRCAILESTAAERNPSLYLMAMNQCWCKDSNGKLLLAAAYLYTVKPSREDGRNTAGAGHWDKCSAGELSVWLIGRMVDCIPELFGGSLPSSEFSQLSRFVRESRYTDGSTGRSGSGRCSSTPASISYRGLSTNSLATTMWDSIWEAITVRWILTDLLRRNSLRRLSKRLMEQFLKMWISRCPILLRKNLPRWITEVRLKSRDRCGL